MFIVIAALSDRAPAERDVFAPQSHPAPLEPELTRDCVAINIWSLRDRSMSEQHTITPLPKRANVASSFVCLLLLIECLAQILN